VKLDHSGGIGKRQLQ
jgi:hypothetical protein